MTKNYLMIQENKVTNICVWDGSTDSWLPPSGVTMLIQEETPTKVWGLNEEQTEYVLVDSVGNACIGFTYDGSMCITNEEKPTDIPVKQVTPPTPATGEIPVTNTGV